MKLFLLRYVSDNESASHLVFLKDNEQSLSSSLKFFTDTKLYVETMQ